MPIITRIRAGVVRHVACPKWKVGQRVRVDAPGYDWEGVVIRHRVLTDGHVAVLVYSCRRVGPGEFSRVIGDVWLDESLLLRVA